jgi:hypothetical protein
MRFVLLLSAAVFFSFPLRAQSLLNNGGFEEMRACPGNVGALELATGWFTVGLTPDLFSQCATPSALGVPRNYVGVQEAHEGKAYIGLALFNRQNNLSRRDNFPLEEGITTNLRLPTQAGRRYTFSFWYCLADSSDFYAKTLTLTLHNKGYYNQAQYVSIQLPAPVAHAWVPLTLTFVATGKWRYMDFGCSRKVFSMTNFRKALHTQTLRKKAELRKKTTNSCYYYFDQFELYSVASSTLQKQ